MISKKIIPVFLLSSALIISHTKASEFIGEFITKGYKPNQRYTGQFKTIVDFCPLSFQILKREIKTKTVPVIRQQVQKNEKDFYARIGIQDKDGPCPIPTLLTIISIFNNRMDDPLAKEVCLLVTQKEAKKNFIPEKTTEATDYGVRTVLSQRVIDSLTHYKHECIDTVPSIVCTTAIHDQYFLDEAIKAVEEE